MVRGSCARIMEPASELRANEVRRNSALKKKERSVRVRIVNKGGTAGVFRSLYGDLRTPFFMSDVK